ncbi:uncharacterized protein EHS24_002034 [Apiotrichum porosum]|uniref:Uncharacterized protein n=1 Tax=Apiotrichum porosum TaxID=105984 RepID=A0A427XJR2_9TREE|nr:uncharacterized protein EHS24_002034 [Apiotrichum porosum]RSH79100.1 hypothetical protein EHS24_002034 [Apiotrichum porosum]
MPAQTRSRSMLGGDTSASAPLPSLRSNRTRCSSRGQKARNHTSTGAPQSSARPFPSVAPLLEAIEEVVPPPTAGRNLKGPPTRPSRAAKAVATKKLKDSAASTRRAKAVRSPTSLPPQEQTASTEFPVVSGISRVGPVPGVPVVPSGEPHGLQLASLEDQEELPPPRSLAPPPRSASAIRVSIPVLITRPLLPPGVSPWSTPLSIYAAYLFQGTPLDRENLIGLVPVGHLHFRYGIKEKIGLQQYHYAIFDIMGADEDQILLKVFKILRIQISV